MDAASSRRSRRGGRTEPERARTHVAQPGRPSYHRFSTFDRAAWGKRNTIRLGLATKQSVVNVPHHQRPTYKVHPPFFSRTTYPPRDALRFASAQHRAESGSLRRPWLSFSRLLRAPPRISWPIRRTCGVLADSIVGKVPLHNSKGVEGASVAFLTARLSSVWLAAQARAVPSRSFSTRSDQIRPHR